MSCARNVAWSNGPVCHSSVTAHARLIRRKPWVCHAVEMKSKSHRLVSGTQQPVCGMVWITCFMVIRPLYMSSVCKTACWTGIDLPFFINMRSHTAKYHQIGEFRNTLSLNFLLYRKVPKQYRASMSNAVTPASRSSSRGKDTRTVCIPPLNPALLPPADAKRNNHPHAIRTRDTRSAAALYHSSVHMVKATAPACHPVSTSNVSRQGSDRPRRPSCSPLREPCAPRCPS